MKDGNIYMYIVQHTKREGKKPETISDSHNYIYIKDWLIHIIGMDNIQIRLTPVQVKINNDDTLLHNWLWSI